MIFLKLFLTIILILSVTSENCVKQVKEKYYSISKNEILVPITIYHSCPRSNASYYFVCENIPHCHIRKLNQVNFRNKKLEEILNFLKLNFTNTTKNYLCSLEVTTIKNDKIIQLHNDKTAYFETGYFFDKNNGYIEIWNNDYQSKQIYTGPVQESTLTNGNKTISFKNNETIYVINLMNKTEKFWRTDKFGIIAKEIKENKRIFVDQQFLNVFDKKTVYYECNLKLPQHNKILNTNYNNVLNSISDDATGYKGSTTVTTDIKKSTENTVNNESTKINLNNKNVNTRPKSVNTVNDSIKQHNNEVNTTSISVILDNKDTNKNPSKQNVNTMQSAVIKPLTTENNSLKTPMVIMTPTSINMSTIKPITNNSVHIIKPVSSTQSTVSNKEVSSSTRNKQDSKRTVLKSVLNGKIIPTTITSNPSNIENSISDNDNYQIQILLYISVAINFLLAIIIGLMLYVKCYKCSRNKIIKDLRNNEYKRKTTDIDSKVTYVEPDEYEGYSRPLGHSSNKLILNNKYDVILERNENNYVVLENTDSIRDSDNEYIKFEKRNHLSTKK